MLLSLSVPHNKVFRLNMSEADGERESDLTLELVHSSLGLGLPATSSVKCEDKAQPDISAGYFLSN